MSIVCLCSTVTCIMYIGSVTKSHCGGRINLAGRTSRLKDHLSLASLNFKRLCLYGDAFYCAEQSKLVHIGSYVKFKDLTGMICNVYIITKLSCLVQYVCVYVSRIVILPCYRSRKPFIPGTMTCLCVCVGGGCRHAGNCRRLIGKQLVHFIQSKIPWMVELHRGVAS